MKSRHYLAWPLAALLLLSLAGCGTRSISDSGYRGGYWSGRSDDNRLYRGELSEFDVLGIDRNQVIAEGEIQSSIGARERPTIARGASIMLKSVGLDPLPNYKRHRDARWDAYLNVPDPDALAAEFSSRHVEFSKPLRDTDEGLRGFELDDADGYRLFFGRPRS